MNNDSSTRNEQENNAANDERLATQTFGFIKNVADTLGRGRVVVSHLAGGCSGARLEVSGRAPRAALEGLCCFPGGEVSTIISWRQGCEAHSPLYELTGLGQLADLLIETAAARR